jgi:hypothetical protein
MMAIWTRRRSERPRRSVAWLFASLLCFCLPGAAAAQAGYECRYEKEGAYGKLSAEFELPIDGQAALPPYLRWEGPVGSIGSPRLSAAFYRMTDGRYGLENGFASFQWDVRDRHRRTLKLSVQLRTRPEPPRYGRTALASPLQRSGGPFLLNVEWSDAAALARGARELHLVAVDRKFRLVATVPIDPTIVTGAEPHIIDGFRELEAIIADPARTCTFRDDLQGDDIVLTARPQSGTAPSVRREGGHAR